MPPRRARLQVWANPNGPEGLARVSPSAAKRRGSVSPRSDVIRAIERVTRITKGGRTLEGLTAPPIAADARRAAV